ncbi:conserved hypothetical protein [Solidesulfovibrio fructosivorans JJ]]|uniref:DUF4381 domain-containing protein n=1 Tax=Solidesulfovibrio fructosivorans JJ] TaxID=596151 RepID=E1JTI8_SOLFR|nr:hypothetical protein [Solidesulfovibrio fructosivorans]EFL52448.1 conserved hypothetical protein [Solidesulfovibrio fructosivorans JJ]]
MDDIRDIKGPVGLPAGLSGLGLALALALLAVGGLAVWRWRRERCAPGRRALARVRAGLAALTADAPDLDDRDYYYRLAALAREALAARFALPATAMTTAEILPRLDALPGAEREALAGLFARADGARYAGREVAGADRLGDTQAVARLAARGLAC